MKIGLYYTEDFSEGGGVHKQTADTYEFDDATDTIEFTQTENDYALATDRAVTLSVHDGVTFIPGGSDAGNGIKSITISPAIQTTPALNSVFPIYWEDLTEEEKAEGKKTVLVNADNLTVGDTYTATITSTDTWYAQGDGDWSEQGGSAEDTGTVSEMGGVNAVKFTFGASADPEDDNADYFELTIGITAAGR